MSFRRFNIKQIIFIAIFIFFSDASFAQQKIKIAYFNVPPFIIYNVKEHKLTGGAVYEFLEQHIGPKIGVQFVWEKSPSPVSRLLVSIDNKSVDALALLVYTPERSQKLAFTAIPYYISSPAIVVLKSNKLNKVDKIEDILSLKIGYGQSTYISPFMRDKRINFDLLTSGSFNEQNIHKLMASRLDAVYAPDVAGLLAVIKRLKYEDDIKVIKLPDEASPFHVVFAKNLEDIAGRYNKTFDQIDGKKTFLQILSKYLDISKL